MSFRDNIPTASIFTYTIDAENKIHRILYIYWIDLMGISHLVGEIEQIYSPSYGVSYAIRYLREELEYLDKNYEDFHRIPGCPYDKGKLEFIYPVGKLPTFVIERVPDPRRSDLSELLSKVGLKVYDMFDYMRRTNAVCGNNHMYVHESRDASDFRGTYWHAHLRKKKELEG